MATITDYMFHNLTGLNMDNCTQSQDNIQSINSANYMLTNYYASDCDMNKSINFATQYPSVFYKGSNQVGVGGCNIDANSNITIGSIQTHPKCRISLQQRLFTTVPYLGRGPHNPILESRIQQGDFDRNRKSVNTVTEEPYIDYRSYPLIPSVQSTINNPSNLVEGVAADGWIRGGLPSRELTRDNDYHMHDKSNDS